MIGMALTIFSLSFDPPSLACRMALKYLAVRNTYVQIDTAKGEFLAQHLAKIDPQREIPFIDDHGFSLSESVAILQYLAERYPVDHTFYPKDIRRRAIIHLRLQFNLSTYYKAVSEHVVVPIIFGSERTLNSEKNVNLALDVFDKTLARNGTKYAAGDNLTIADLPLITTTLCLEAINFRLTPYLAVKAWYKHFKRKHPDLWAIGRKGMDQLKCFNEDPSKIPPLNFSLLPARINFFKQQED